MSKFYSIISGPIDREAVVFEIWLDNAQVAEISNEPGEPMMVELYPKPEGGAWRLELSELLRKLEEGKTSLSKR